MGNLARYILRRWVWVVVLALIGGLLGLGAGLRAKQTYVAQSLVVLSDAQIPAESFADAASAIFPTDTVLLPVITQKGLDATPRSLIASGALAVQSTPGGLAVRVIARSEDSQQATDLANAAAGSLTQAANDNGFGQASFLPVQEAQLQPKPTVRYVVAGVVAGAILAAAVLAIWFFLHERPRRSETETSPSVTVRVRVEADDQRTITPQTSLTGLWFGFVSPSPAMDVTGIVIQEGNSAWAVTAVADELSWMAANDGRGKISWRDASEPPTGAMADRVVVIAPAGMSERLQDVRREIAAHAPGAFVALVLAVASGPH